MRFEKLSVEHGLSQATINTIFQDRQGLMWFGTQDGLNRYDGYEFTVFRRHSSDRKSISGNFITTIFEDSDGILWFGVRGGGLNRFDPKIEVFTHFRMDHNNTSTLSDDSIYAIVEDEQGFLWLGTPNGLNRMDRHSETFKRFLHDENNIYSLKHNRVLSISKDRNGFIWLGSSSHLSKFDPQNEVFIHFKYREELIGKGDLPFVKSIITDVDNNLWFGTNGDGVYFFNQSNGRFKHYKHSNQNINGLANDHLLTLFEDSNHQLWLGSYGGGLSLYNKASDSFLHFKHHSVDSDSISSDFVLSIYEDSGSNLWLGTGGGGGINKFDPRTLAFHHYRHSSSNNNRLSDRSVYAIEEDPFGNIWFGTRGGLDKVDLNTGNFQHYFNDANDPYSLSDNNILSILSDSYQNLWVGTRGGGLNYMNRETEKFTRFKKGDNQSKSINSNFVLSLFEDSDNKFWVGTIVGLNLLDRKAKQFLPLENAEVPLQSNQNTGLESKLSSGVMVIYEDRKKNFWLGTREGGLVLFDRSTFSEKQFKHNDADPKSISSDFVLCLFEDSAGQLWIGTEDGLNRFNEHDQTFTIFQSDDGLANNVVYGVLEDENGELWISTNNGISHFNSSKQTFENFDVNDGLQGNEFNFGAHLKDSVGQMYFGGVNGVTRFDPSEVVLNKQSPKIVFTQFLLFNQSVPILTKGVGMDRKERTFSLSRHLNFLSEIELSYSDYIFTFEFSALNFRQSEKNKYKYMLEGLDSQWVETDYRHRRATYTNLSHGDYVFRVKASNDDGVWNDEGISIIVKVIPPFWKTTWFLILVMTAVISLSIGLHVYRTRLLTIRTKVLQQKVNERTRDLAIANNNLQKQATIDELTGIANRRKYHEFLALMWRNCLRQRQSISIILLDVDYFKLYNDHYGHQMGDHCLKAVAKVIEKTVHRASDLAARFGGEEFVIVLVNTESEGALNVAEKVRVEIESLAIEHEKSTVNQFVTISLGVSTLVPDSSITSDLLVKMADEALYRSKNNGRNQTTCY